MSRRKKIHGHRRRKSPFRGDIPDNYYESDYFETAKKGDYCPPQPKSMTDAEYSRYCELKGFKKPDFTTFNEPKKTSITDSHKLKTKELKTSVVTGTPPIVGPRTLKFIAELSKQIDLERQISEAYKQWTTGFTHSGRGND